MLDRVKYGPKYTARLRVVSKGESRLSLLSYYKLITVFNKHNWDINFNNDNGRFQKFLKLLRNLSQEESELFLELSKRFIDFPQSKYYDALKEVVISLVHDYPEHHFHVVPAISKNTIEPKSSSTVAYMFKGDRISSDVDIKKTSFHVCQDAEKVKNKQFTGNDILLLVDDFIGSGETIDKSLEFYSNNGRRTPEECIILSLYAHTLGLNYLSSKKYKVYYWKSISREISDYYEGQSLEKNKEIMMGIESKIEGLDPKFSFGYKKCEALIMLQRIPNNTFPIYWADKKLSPFQR